MQKGVDTRYVLSTARDSLIRISDMLNKAKDTDESVAIAILSGKVDRVASVAVRMVQATSMNDPKDEEPA
jgi:hypothetical protein